MENIDKTTLIPFLDDLTTKIKSDKLSSDQLQQIGEFYMAYTVMNNTDDTEVNNIDIIKFITLGWYFYKCLLKKDND